MARNSNLTVDSAWLLAAQVATLAAGFAALLAITRMCSAEEVGRWRYSQAFLAFLLIGAEGGYTGYAVRELARGMGNDEAIVRSTAILRVMTVSVALGCIIGGLSILGEVTATVALVGVFGFSAMAVSVNLSYILQSREEFRQLALMRIAVQVASGVGVVGAVYYTRSLLFAACAMTVAAVLGAVLVARKTRRLVKVWGPVDFKNIWITFKGASPFLATGFVLQMSSNIDALLIRGFASERELGFYTPPHALSTYTLFIGAAFMSAAYPRLASAQDQESVNRLVRGLAGMLGTVAFPIGLGGMAISDVLLGTLFGVEYEARWSIFSLLMTVPLVGFFNLLLSQTLAARGFQQVALRVALGVSLLSALFYALVIPRWGITGAASVLVFSELVTLALYGLLGFRQSVRTALQAYCAALPYGAAMGAVLVVAKFAGVVNLYALLALGVSVYTLCQLYAPTEGAKEILKALKC